MLNEAIGLLFPGTGVGFGDGVGFGVGVGLGIGVGSVPFKVPFQFPCHGQSAYFQWPVNLSPYKDITSRKAPASLGALYDGNLDHVP